jgi:hypothetical protein
MERRTLLHYRCTFGGKGRTLLRLNNSISLEFLKVSSLIFNTNRLMRDHNVHDTGDHEY